MMQPYTVDDVLIDLLDVAARSLKPGCRLCYLMSSTYVKCTLQELPGHPCMKLVAHSVQGLTKTLGRR
jgi:tRNA (guanine10-N2)-methyltransferase